MKIRLFIKSGTRKSFNSFRRQRIETDHCSDLFEAKNGYLYHQKRSDPIVIASRLTAIAIFKIFITFVQVASAGSNFEATRA